jgi:RHS repeat-associated protein
MLIGMANSIFSQPNYNLPEDPSGLINIPPSPSAGELGKFGYYPVSLATGNPDISIPIHTMKGGDIPVPVSLRYQAGIKVNDKASWVGLGWTLDAGGVITRNVRGIADEKLKGYLNQGIPDAYALVPADNYQYVIDVTRGKHDNQADIFTFSFGGQSGKFMFQQDGTINIIPYNPDIQINYNISQGRISEFTIIDQNGTTYIFDQAERTNATNYIPEAGTPTTAWYLSKIIAVNGIDEVEFTYDNLGNKYFDIPDVQTQYLKFTNPINPNSYQSEIRKAYDKGDYVVQNMRRLSMIETNSGKIVFNHSTGNRLDDPNDNDVRLDQIEIFNADNQLVKIFNLNYNHFQSAGFSYLKLEHTFRLKLESIQEVGFDNGISTSKPEYEFEYVEGSGINLPPRHTSAQDYWGYFNGNISANLIPRKEYVLQNASIIQLGSADRTPHATKMMAGSIRSIKYPTGGKTVFEFEPHRAELDYTTYSEISRFARSQVVHVANMPAPGVYEHTESFSVGNLIGTNTVRSSVNFAVTTDPGRQVNVHYYTTIRMTDLTTGNIIIEKLNDTLPGHIAVWLHANHDYELYTRCIPANINMPNPQATTHINVYWKEQNETQIVTDEIIGGLRIANISNYDSDHTTLLTSKSYEYTKPNDPASSSGNFNQRYRPEPNSFYKQRSIRREVYPSGCLSCEIQEDLIVSMTANPTSASGFLSNPVTYQYVTIYDGQKNGNIYPNGRTLSEFSVAKDHWYPDYGGIGDYNSDRSYLRGLPLNSKIYDSNNNLVSETRNEYEHIDMQNDILGIKLGGFYDIHWNDLLKQEFDDHCLCPLVMSSGTGSCLFIACYPPVNQVINERYQFKYNFADPLYWVRLKSSESIVDGISTLEEYKYNPNGKHKQAIEVSKTNSDGSLFITRTKFVRDFDIQPGYYTSNDWRTKSLYTLNNKNLNHAIENLTYLQKPNETSPKLISSSLQLYKEMNNTGIPLLHEVWGTETLQRIPNFSEAQVNNNFQFVKENHYKYQGIQQPTFVVTSYNDHSKITETHKTYDIPSSYLWDNEFQLLRAKCQNAHANQIAFTSFEHYDSSQENWTYFSSCRSSGNAKVGSRKLQFASTCTSISRSNLPSGNYIVGFWAKSNLDTGSKLDITGSSGLIESINITDSWSYYEIKVTNTSTVSISPSGSGIQYIDELRLHPVDGRMETFTYRKGDLLLIALGGTNGNISTYEYDGLKRLSLTRDFEGNIISTNEYHYKLGNNDHNWVKSSKVRVPGVFSLSDFNNLSHVERDAEIEYMDGIGRPIQSIGIGQSPSGKDLIQMYEYDDFGREIKHYLPFTRSNTNGAFVDNANTYQNLFYGSINNAYGYVESELLDAPLERTLKLSAPGNTWKIGSGHETETEYEANGVNEVRRFDSQGNSSGYYPPSELLVIRSTDENENVITNYYDKLGNELMTDNNGSKTYKVYDDFGRIVYIVPPKAFNKMVSTGNYSCGFSSVSYNNVYKYTFDQRGRFSSKTIPGKKTDYYYYDKLDRLVMTKDGKNQKVVTKFDIIGRPVITGLYNGSAVPSINDGVYENESSGTYGYTLNQTFPSSNVDVLTVNYYDHHDFNRNDVLEASEKLIPDASGDFTLEEGKFNKGKITGTKAAYFIPGKRIIEGYTETKNYYDQRGRSIQTRFRNHTNEEEITFNAYNFRDLLLKSKHLHRANLASAHSTITEREFIYDHFGRLLEAYHQIDGGAKVLIYKNSFSEKGRLRYKKLGATDPAGTKFLQTINYHYNIRGWMTGINTIKSSCGPIIIKDEEIFNGLRSNTSRGFGNDAGPDIGINPLPLVNDDLFSMEIHYDAPKNVSNLPNLINPQYNGNISSIIWQSGCGNAVKYYGFNYDNKNQLLDAYYGEGSNKSNLDYTNAYDMHASYDLNGNIRTLSRNENGNLIDDLNYTYDEANHLTDLEELSSLSSGFKSGNSVATYSYDDNGNMNRDNHRAMDVHYSFLNLPNVIGFDNEDSLIFRYDARGTKLAKYSKANGQSLWSIKTYLGSFEYEDDQLIATYFEEGRAALNGNAFQYEYCIKDHLGNSRLTFSDLNGDGKVKRADGEVLQENHYYPFGMSMSGSWNQVVGAENMYQFNGKEMNNDFGLDWVDYGARWYDPAIGRWHSIDPVAESEEYVGLNPYHFVRNNPIKLYDLNGMYDYEWNFNTETGEITWVRRTGEEGSDRQIINYVDGDGKVLKTATIKGNKVFIGPVALDYDGGWEWRAASGDLWEGVPESYLGHYTAWDLDERRRARINPKQGKYKRITDQEEAGLDRRDMVWNDKDRSDMIYEIYGSTSGLVVAHYYEMLEEMLPSSGFAKGFRSLKSLQKYKGKPLTGKIRIKNAKRLQQAVDRAKKSRVGAPATQKLLPAGPQYKALPAAPANPWNRFLRMNSGKYKGAGWQKRAARDYRGGN